MLDIADYSVEEFDRKRRKKRAFICFLTSYIFWDAVEAQSQVVFKPELQTFRPAINKINRNTVQKDIILNIGSRIHVGSKFQGKHNQFLIKKTKH